MATTLPTYAALGLPLALPTPYARWQLPLSPVGTHAALLPLPMLALILLGVAACVFLANPRDALVRLFAPLMVACAVVVAANPAYIHGDPWGRAIEVGADGLGASLFVRFCFAFPERQPRVAPPVTGWMRALYHAGPMVPLVTSLVELLTEPRGGSLLVFGQVCFCLGLIFSVALGPAALLRTFRLQPRPEVRGPILAVLVGTALTFAPLVAFNVVPPLFFLPDPIPFSGTQYGLIALPAAIGFATIRWRKASFLALIDRLSVYLVLGLLLLACLAALMLAFAHLQGVAIGSISTLVPLALAIFAAISFAPLRASLLRLVDTALYRDYYDLAPTLQRFSRSLATLRDRDAVATSLLEDLRATLNLTGAALMLLPGGYQTAAPGPIQPGDLYTCGDLVSEAERASLAAHISKLDLSTIDISRRRPVLVDPCPGCAALVLVGPSAREDISALLLIGPKRKGGSLRDDDRALLGTIAHQAATALENAVLYDGLRATLGQLSGSTDQLKHARAEQQLLLREVVDADERQRAALARDLHDDALQDLMYLSRHGRYCAELLEARAIGSPLPSSVDRLREEIDQLAEAAATAERKVRDLCAGLYPALIESLGLPAALEALAEEAGAGDQRVQALCEPEAELLATRLDADVRLHVYRIAQEALRNASRHAGASHITLRLATERAPLGDANASPGSAPSLALTVADDGSGISLPVDYVALLRAGHLGMASMRERAERIGAELRITRDPVQGTRIALSIPLPAPRPPVQTSPRVATPVSASNGSRLPSARADDFATGTLARSSTTRGTASPP